MVFIVTPIFTADVQALLSDKDDAALQRHLVSQPDAGDVIAGTGGLRKVRWTTPGRGKRGGTSSDSNDSDLPQGHQRRPDAQGKDGVAQN